MAGRLMVRPADVGEGSAEGLLSESVRGIRSGVEKPPRYPTTKRMDEILIKRARQMRRVMFMPSMIGVW